MTQQILIGTNGARRQATERASAIVVAVALLGSSAWAWTTLPVQGAFILVLATWVVFIAWLRTTSASRVKSTEVVATSTLRDRSYASHRPSYDIDQSDRLFQMSLTRRF